MSDTSPTPPRPRRWLRWLKRLGWCALWFVTLIALLVVFENWRGRRAWAAFVAETKAAGDDVTMDSLIPPLVPDEDNLAMAPLFQPVSHFIQSSNGTERIKRGPGFNRLQQLQVTDSKTPKANGGWRAGRFTDLPAWQAHYRAGTNFPSNPMPSSPGAGILFALGKLNPEHAALREAAARPHSRFPVRYEDTFSALLAHAAQMKKLTLLCHLRAVAELAEHRVEDAATDTLLALRVVEALAEEPFLISHLVRMAQLEIAATPLWEGLARHQWTTPHLAAFEARLAGMDFTANCLRAIRGERNGAFAGLDMMRNQPEQYEMLAEIGDGDPGSPWSAFRFMPSAFTDHSKVAIGRMFQDYLRAVDLKARRFDPEIPVKVDHAMESLKPTLWRKPYHILASLLMPALTKSAQTFARAQTTVDLARVAIALERHQLKHGALPETLDAIDPALKPAGGIPHDVISGGPLRYTRTAHGRFHLYAVGWNGTDEGGSTAWRDAAKTQIDYTQGDWIWPQPVE